MNKKFLSAILFGALMVPSTGTFVSCKDYDDEIDNLQEQIDNLATKSDVETKLSQLQAAIDAAKAESAANAAKIAALTKCECDVDAMMKKIQDAVDADMAEYKAEIEALVEEVEALVGKVADFVTSVELVVSSATTGYDNELTFSTAIEKENVFSKDINNAITFVKNAEIQTADQFLVRVSPANAVLTEEMISLVNSKGENLDELVEVVEVKKFESLLTKAATNNGLWVVKTQLKAYGNGDALKAAKAKDGKAIVYAAQVNNSISAAEARYVTSTYDLTLDWEPYKAANKLQYTVDGVDVQTIANRVKTAEYEWSGAAAVAPDTEDPGKNVTPGDDRSDLKVFAPAVQGEPVKIELFELNDKKEKVAPSNIRAIYVTLDKKANAHESAPSEWNAWNSYTYTGLNTVVEGTSTTITIDSEKAINDYIGFRVYAVNYDGTLVDPDGKAFYALVGDQADEITAIATSITATSNTLVATEAVEVKALAELGNYKFSWEMDDEDQVPFNLNFVTSDGALNIYSAPDGQKSQVYNINQVLKIAAKPTEPWYEYEDGKTYYGTLKAYKVVDNNEFVAATLKVSFTKNIPTAAPEGFSVKTNQVVNGIYNCYLLPNDTKAEAAATGSMEMAQIFNFPTAATQANYSIKFATSQYNVDAEAYTDAQTVVGTGAVVVDKKLIDNAGKHVTTATYNYGQVSSVQYAAHEADADVTADYILPVPEVNFETVYNCIYNDTYTFDWATHAQLGLTKDKDGNYPELPYKTAVTYGDTDFKVSTKHIYGTSAWDSDYNKFLNENTSLAIKSVALTSDANGVAEYFDVTVSGTDLVFTQKSGATNPNAAVPSTLTIKMKDMYGCDKVIKLAITVNKR